LDIATRRRRQTSSAIVRLREIPARTDIADIERDGLIIRERDGLRDAWNPYLLVAKTQAARR
jgi:hypothetical protein